MSESIDSPPPVPPHRSIKDLTGQTFGRLTVLAYAGHRVTKKGRKHQLWQCACSCGAELPAVDSDLLTSGDKQSCGCQRRDRNISRNWKHGQTASPEFQSWKAMKRRCLNPKASGYRHYGGRGIGICARWLDPESGFTNFLEDMGPRPEGTSLERKDGNGNYC